MRTTHTALGFVAALILLGALGAYASGTHYDDVVGGTDLFNGGEVTTPIVAPAVTAATFTATAGGGIYSDTFGSTSGVGIEVRDSLTLPADGSITYEGRVSISSPAPGEVLYSIPGTELGLRLGSDAEYVPGYYSYDGSTLLPFAAASLAADTVTATTSVTTGAVAADSCTADTFTATAPGGIYSDTFGSTSGAGITCSDEITLPSIRLTQAPGEPPPGITGTDPLVLSQSKYGYLKLAGGVGVPGMSLPEIKVSDELYLGPALIALASPTGDELALTDISQSAPVPLIIGPADDDDSVRLTASTGGVLTLGRPGLELLAQIDARTITLTGTLTTPTVTASALVSAPVVQGESVRVSTTQGSQTSIEIGPATAATFPADPGAATATATGVRLVGRRIVGVSGRVTTAGTGCAAVNVGDGVDEDRYGAAIAVTEGATIGQEDATADPGEWLAAVGDVVVTGYASDGTTPADCIDLQITFRCHYLSYEPQQTH